MIAALQSLYNTISTFFGSVWGWLDTGLHDAAVWAYASSIEYYTLASLKFKLRIINFAWDVAKQILIDLNFSATFNEYYSLIPDYIQVNLSALRIPQGITLIVTALVTKYVLRFIPGGR